MIKDFNVEELKVAVSAIMQDMRGNWGYDYYDRLISTQELLEELLEKDTENVDIYQQDIDVVTSELASLTEHDHDGRAFRDMANLYSYRTEEGSTQRVYDYLETILTYPEYNQIDVLK